MTAVKETSLGDFMTLHKTTQLIRGKDEILT